MCSGHTLHLLLRERGLTWRSTFTSVCACACVLTTLIVDLFPHTSHLESVVVLDHHLYV